MSQETPTPWPFDQPRNCATFTTRQVLEQTEPIVFVSHDAEDHGWQFIGPSGARMADAKIVYLHQIVSIDSSVLEIADLPPGWHAERETPGAPWIRQESLPEKTDPNP